MTVVLLCTGVQVVFVAQLVEDSIVKCEQYWPDDSTPCLYDVISVTLTSTTSYANFVVRSFYIRHVDDDRDVQEHCVTHYQFTAWPEHGVPRSPLALLEFHTKVATGSTIV